MQEGMEGMLRQKSPGGPLVSLVPEDAKPPPSPQSDVKRGSRTQGEDWSGTTAAVAGGTEGAEVMKGEEAYAEDGFEEDDLADQMPSALGPSSTKAADPAQGKGDGGVQHLKVSTPRSPREPAAPSTVRGGGMSFERTPSGRSPRDAAYTSSVRGGHAIERTASGRSLGPEQKEQEARSHALMSDWLQSMPPTTPFHRGHVLIVAESAYKQKVGKSKKGSQSARGSRRDRGDGDGKAPNSARSSKDARDNLFAYETPAQKRIKQQNSRLHDVLQHSQAQLVSVRTRAHRNLDSDRMDRTEIAKQKHQLMLERRAAGKGGGKAATGLLSSVGGSQSSKLRKSWPVSERGDISRTASSVQQSPSSAVGDASSPKTPGTKPAAPASDQAAASPKGDAALDGPGGGGAKLATPKSPGGRGGGTADEKSKDRTKDAGDDVNAVRIAAGSAKNLDQQLLDLPGFLELVQSEGSHLARIPSQASSKAGGGVPRIESPHSVAAMKAQGLVEEDLLPRPFSDFFRLDRRERATVVAGLKRHEGTTIVGEVLPEHLERLLELEGGNRVPEAGRERDKLVALRRKLKDARTRCAFEESSRQQLIEGLEEQRGRKLRAQAVLVPHNAGREPGKQLAAFGQIARAAFVAGGKVGAKSGPSYVEETALAVLEKARARQSHMDEIERARTEMEVKGGIAARDSIHDLEEKIEESEAKRAMRLAAMQENLREKREARMREASARVAEKHQRQREEFEELMERRGERMGVARERLSEARERIADRAREGALLAQMKHDRFVRKTQMSLRALDNRARELEMKEEKSHVGVERIAAEKFKVQRESEAQRLRLMEKRTKVRNLVDSFRETGEFRIAEEDVLGLEEIEQLVDLNSSAVGNLREDFVDRNKAASWLPRNQEVVGHVVGDSYKFFKIKQANTRSRITIVLHSLEGECELVIGNGDCETPTRETHTWSATNLLEKKIIIHPFDKGFMLGMLYIGVYGASQHCKFDLIAKWKDDKEALPLLSRRGTQIEGVPASPRHMVGGGEPVASWEYDEGDFEKEEEQGDEGGGAKGAMSGEGKQVRSGQTAKRGGDAGGRGASPLKSPGRATDLLRTEAVVRRMSSEQLAGWLRELNLSPEVIEMMQKEGVSGERVALLAASSVLDLKNAFGMSTLQAKRIVLNIVRDRGRGGAEIRAQFPGEEWSGNGGMPAEFAYE